MHVHIKRQQILIIQVIWKQIGLINYKTVCSLGGFIWYENKIGCRLFNIFLNEQLIPL